MKFSAKAFTNLVSQWEKCIEVEGDYIENEFFVFLKNTYFYRFYAHFPIYLLKDPSI